MKALVTGANGHLGFNLCKALIDRGHAVRASVRALGDRTKTVRLRTLASLELVELDICRPDQWRDALNGVDVLFHLAAVYAYVVERGREEEMVVRPSVEGAECALRAAADMNVAKVVLTSSLVTLPLTERGAPQMTETDWTDDLRVPYMRAKTLAEKRAWDLARELNVNLVTILPGAICGPGFGRNTPSIDIVEGIMRGTMRMVVPDANFPYVDIRDVVSAQILAAEKNCGGRFAVCNDHLPSFAEMIEAMRAVDPTIPRPMMTLPGLMEPLLPLFDRLNQRMLGTPRVMSPELMATVRGKVWNVSNARAKRELGWQQAIPLDVSLRDTIEAIKVKDAYARDTATA